jgi:hypothetical protein
MTPAEDLLGRRRPDGDGAIERREDDSITKRSKRLHGAHRR